MIQFANAKINIGLHILGKRPDGYHDLETVFYPIPLFDVVEVIESKETSCESSGYDLPGGQADNLCLRAYDLLRRDFDLPPVTIYLHKTIPVGAGLGGGSSDAVATLRGLNRRFGLDLNADSLENYARQLGSDCAFFVRNRASFARGKGDRLEEIELDLKGYRLLLIKPAIHISTAEAYRGVRPGQAAIDLRQAVRKPLAEWQKTVGNDFETTLFREHPILQQIKTQLYNQGAFYASMSGSGSAVYGIFEGHIPAVATDSLQELSGENEIFQLELPG